MKPEKRESLQRPDAAAHAGTLLLNPQDQSVPVLLNSKWILLHHRPEDHQIPRPLQKDPKHFPSVLCSDLTLRESSPKDHSYTLHYHLRSFCEMLAAWGYLVGVDTVTSTSMLCKRLVQSWCAEFSGLRARCPDPCPLETCTPVWSVRKCSALLMDWRCMHGGRIMARGPLLVNCAARLLDMRSALASIGEHASATFLFCTSMQTICRILYEYFRLK